MKVSSPDWPMPLMLSLIQCLPCVQTLRLAGCNWRIMPCVFILLLERIFSFFHSEQSWVIKLYRRIFSLPTPLGFCCSCPLPHKRKKKCCRICALTSLWGFSAPCFTVSLRDEKAPYLKPQTPRRGSKTSQRMPCVGTVMQRELVNHWPFCLSGR